MRGETREEGRGERLRLEAAGEWRRRIGGLSTNPAGGSMMLPAGLSCCY
ncbi:MAG: hypothetical protein ACK55Z_14735 [bacterium]